MNTIVDQSQALITATCELPRFGECTYSETDVFTFPWGLPGFAHLRRFLTLTVPEDVGYFWLQSIDDVSVAIPVCDPWSIYPDYEAPLPSYAKQSLGITSAEGFCVLTVLVARPDSQTTINLLAPIILNIETRVGRQITLENQLYGVRMPVRPGFVARKEGSAQP